MDKIRQYEQLLAALRAQRYVSGSVLAEELAVSRTLVNRRLQELREMGLTIHAVTGKGYHLTSDVSLLTQRPAGLPDHWGFHRHLITRSTNDDLLALASLHPEPMVITTEFQTAGKGRRGRPWQSSFGQDLAVSFGFPIESFEALRPYSLCTGVLIARLLRQCGPYDVRVKWPNDLQIHGAKLAGILTELHTLQGRPYVIIGLGLNVNGINLDTVDQPATSLREHLGGLLDRDILLSAVCEALAGAVQDEFSLPWHQYWPDLDALFGKTVTVRQGDNRTEGTAAGVAVDGSFLLRTQAGVIPFNGGQVRVRA